MQWRADDPGPRNPQQIIDDQAREIDRLREDLRRSEAERQRLRRENEKLKDELEAARRAVYRQAAPFSRGVPTQAPRRPGRKPGAAYGPCAYRGRPARIDETYDVPLPAQELRPDGSYRPGPRETLRPPLRAGIRAFCSTTGRGAGDGAF